MKTVMLVVVLFAVPTFAQPHITAVVSGADSQPGITLGGLATIYGTALSDAPHFLSGLPYPTKLGPTDVLLCVPTAAQYASVAGCTSVALTYASPTQVNVYLPSSLPALPGMGPDSLSIVVRNGGTLDVDAAAGKPKVFSLGDPHPRIFSEGYDCLTDTRYKDANVNCGLTFSSTLPLVDQAVRGAVADQRGVLLSSTNRARIGQYYTIWLTGLGTFVNGKPASPIAMAFGDVPVFGYKGSTSFEASLSYVGPSPEFPGLYQINFQLPSVVAEGKGPGYGNYFPCADYNWEISLVIGQGTTVPYMANPVQIPVAVKNGDVSCAK